MSREEHLPTQFADERHRRTPMLKRTKHVADMLFAPMQIAFGPNAMFQGGDIRPRGGVRVDDDIEEAGSGRIAEPKKIEKNEARLC